MKIWTEFGSEHSANLVIIGKFQTVAEAEEAERLLSEATRLATRDAERGNPRQQGRSYSDEMLEFIGQTGIQLAPNDPEQLTYVYDAKRKGDEIVITTEEMAVQAFFAVMISKGARIEVFSGHDYPSPRAR